MAGSGTFNLTALWRALGIKNPEPTMRESIQPVLVVADFAQLTPQHRPLTATYGGNVAAVAGERPIIQLTSLAPGGTLVGFMRHDSVNLMNYSQGAAQAGLVAVTPAVLQGGATNNMLSLVEKGTVAANPGSTSASPGIDKDSAWEFSRYPFWISRGQIIFFWQNIVAGSINNWALQIVDLPASQAPEA